MGGVGYSISCWREFVSERRRLNEKKQMRATRRATPNWRRWYLRLSWATGRHTGPRSFPCSHRGALYLYLHRCKCREVYRDVLIVESVSVLLCRYRYSVARRLLHATRHGQVQNAGVLQSRRLKVSHTLLGVTLYSFFIACPESQTIRMGLRVPACHVADSSKPKASRTIDASHSIQSRAKMIFSTTRT